MTEHSYNGWPASRKPADLGVVPLVVAGVEFVGGVRKGDVHDVFEHVATQFHHRVEPLRSPGCWGWSYRANRNDPNELSNHSSATAIDCNAPEHPNGVEAAKTFSAKQIAEVHQILSEIPELDEVVHWGGDWHRANGLIPDSMHFEIHDHDTAKLARVAARIRNTQEDDMPFTDWPKKDQDALADAVAARVWAKILTGFPAGDSGHKSGRNAMATVVDVYIFLQRLVRKSGA